MRNVKLKSQSRSIKRMVTVLVIYTHTKITPKYEKRYAFNVEKKDVKVGDMLKSAAYSTPMQVVKVLDKSYKYFNKENGDLSDTFNNANQFEVRELIISDDSDTITASRVK